jgi:hypothetical protein
MVRHFDFIIQITGRNNFFVISGVVHDSPFTIISSPETIAALQDLTNILSSKLKKKWLTLEGKMKSFGYDAPLLDVGKNSAHLEKNENGGDGLEILIPRGRTEIKQTEPNSIDVSLVKEAIGRENYEQVMQMCISTFCDSGISEIR